MILEAIANGELSEERYLQYIKLKKESLYNTDSEQYLRAKKEKFKQIAKINKKWSFAGRHFPASSCLYATGSGFDFHIHFFEFA